MKSILKNSKFIFVFLITIALSLIFLKFLEPVLLSIGNSIDYEHQSFMIGYLIIFSVLILVYSLVFLRYHIQGKTINFLVLYISILYFLLRFQLNSEIQFTPINSSLKFADIILLICLLHSINLIINNLKYRKIKDEKGFFLEDIPNDEKSESANEKLIVKLLDNLSGFKPNEAFTIGINAVWGQGKSTFLKRFKFLYEDLNPKDIIFWNRIWKNKGSTAIIENFFEELKTQLKPYSSEISNDIDNYVTALLSLSNSNLNSIANQGRQILSENSTLEAFYKNINEDIYKINKQVVILLDDLDRLEQAEILNTLKLIRTLSDFNNVIFIAGYDRKYIVKTLNSEKNNYLDKIFNVEINLLYFDHKILIDNLYEHIDQIFPDELIEIDTNNFNKGFKQLFNYTLEESFLPTIDFFSQEDQEITTHELSYIDFLSTYRDIKRFLNEFRFYTSFIDDAGDIIIEEYILLRLLNYKYRSLQNDIFEKLSNFLATARIDDVNNTLYVNNILGDNQVYLYETESRKKIRQYLDDHDYSQNDKTIIDAVFIQLFRKKSNRYYEINQNSISKIYYTNLYVRNNIAAGQITLKNLQTAFENANLHSLSKNEISESNKSTFQIVNEVKQFIYNNKPNTKEQYLDSVKTLNLISTYGNYKQDQEIKEIIASGYNDFYEKRKDYFDDLSEMASSKDENQYLLDLFSQINMNFKRKQSGLYNKSELKDENENLISPSEVERILFLNLKKLISSQASPEQIISAYLNCASALVYNRNFIFSFNANSIVRQDMYSRSLVYFKSSVLNSIFNSQNEKTRGLINYEPKFYIAQIFSNRKTHYQLIKSPNDEKLYKRFYEEGWINFLHFLKNQPTNVEELLEKKPNPIYLQDAISFVDSYTNNNCEPLTKEEYNNAINHLPF